MATSTKSNKYTYYLATGQIDFSSDEFKVLLMSDSFVFDETTMFLLSDVTEDDWESLTAYSSGAIRIPTTANGHKYACTTAGTSAASEPAWPTTSGGTVTDGTVVWTEAGSDDQLPTANGYTQNSKTLTLTAVTPDAATGDTLVEWDDPSWVASGGYLGSADGGVPMIAGALIVDSSASDPIVIGYFEFTTAGFTADGQGLNLSNLSVEVG